MPDMAVYVLMVDKRGWKSLERENAGLNTEYLRVNRYVSCLSSFYLLRNIRI